MIPRYARKNAGGCQIARRNAAFVDRDESQVCRVHRQVIAKHISGAKEKDRAQSAQKRKTETFFHAAIIGKKALRTGEKYGRAPLDIFFCARYKGIIKGDTGGRVFRAPVPPFFILTAA
jgi:hypothetical protein